MKELCPRLLEPKRPHIEGKPEFSIYNACKRIRELGGHEASYYDCPDCRVTQLPRRRPPTQ
jgi:hypothetical protein